MDSQSVLYESTNESLKSIVVGLDIVPGQRVLAVCGSGDQAFALIAAGATVVAVDSNPAQIAFAQHRVERLKQHDFLGFVNAKNAERQGRIRHFDRHYNAIHTGLDQLTLLHLNLFHETPEGPFDAAYLSNIFGHYTNTGSTHEMQDAALARIAFRMPMGGKIYVATEHDAISRAEGYQFGVPGEFSPYLRIHSALTKIARDLSPEIWDPVVYKKIAEPRLNSSVSEKPSSCPSPPSP